MHPKTKNTTIFLILCFGLFCQTNGKPFTISTLITHEMWTNPETKSSMHLPNTTTDVTKQVQQGMTTNETPRTEKHVTASVHMTYSKQTRDINESNMGEFIKAETTTHMKADQCTTCTEINSSNISDISSVQEKQVDQSLRLYNFIINVIIDGILCIFGFIGNILIIIVFQKQKKKCNNILLQGLAVFDMLFLVYVMFYVIMRSIHSFTGIWPQLDAAQPYIVAFVLPFGWTSQTGTIWTLSVAAIDRYIAVSMPLKHRAYSTPKTARIAVTITALVTVAFNAPRWPHYYFVAFHPESLNHTGSTFLSHVSVKIPLWDEDLYRMIYHISLTYIFIFIIPLAVLITVNTLLIMNISKAGKERDIMTQTVRRLVEPSDLTKASIKSKIPKDDRKAKTSKTSIRITKTIIIVVTIFIFCQLPDFVASIIGRFDHDRTIYAYYAGAKEMLLVFNSSCNFYIYMILHKQFNRTCKNLFSKVTCCNEPQFVPKANSYELNSASYDYDQVQPRLSKF